MFDRLRRVVGSALFAFALSVSPASAQSDLSGISVGFEMGLPAIAQEVIKKVVEVALKDSANFLNECGVTRPNPTMDEVLQACAARGISAVDATRLYFNGTCFLCQATIAIQGGMTAVMKLTAQQAASSLASLLTIFVGLYLVFNIMLVFLPWGLAQGVWERLIVALGAYALAMSWMPGPDGSVKLVEWAINPVFELALSYSNYVREGVMEQVDAAPFVFCKNVVNLDKGMIGGDLRNLLCSTNAVESQLKFVINGSILNITKCYNASWGYAVVGTIASMILFLAYGLSLVVIGGFILEAVIFVGLIGIFAPVLTGLVVFPFTRSMVWTSLRIVLRSGLTVTFLVIIMAVLPMVTGVVDGTSKQMGATGLFEDYFQGECLTLGHARFVSLVLAGVMIFMVTGVCRSIADALSNAPGTGSSGLSKFAQIAPAIVTRAAFGVPMRMAGGAARMATAGAVKGVVAGGRAASKWVTGNFF